MTDLQPNEPCPHCGRYDNRAVTVDAVIMNQQRVLLVRRGVEPFKGYWAAPGGYVEKNESAEDAVVRETEEETGLSVAAVRFIGVYSSPQRHPQQAVAIAYLVSVNQAGVTRPGDDANDVQWFDLRALPEQIAFDHRQIIHDAAALQ